MSRFDALISATKEMGGELPETFMDDVTNSYTEDMSVVTGKVEALSAELAELQAENLALKSHNYDLIMSGKAEPGSDEPTGDEPTGDEPDDDDDEDISDLYEEH